MVIRVDTHPLAVSCHQSEPGPRTTSRTPHLATPALRTPRSSTQPVISTATLGGRASTRQWTGCTVESTGIRPWQHSEGGRSRDHGAHQHTPSPPTPLTHPPTRCRRLGLAAAVCISFDQHYSALLLPSHCCFTVAGMRPRRHCHYLAATGFHSALLSIAPGIALLCYCCSIRL
jgi:hypothetical protein